MVIFLCGRIRAAHSKCDAMRSRLDHLGENEMFDEIAESHTRPKNRVLELRQAKAREAVLKESNIESDPLPQ